MAAIDITTFQKQVPIGSEVSLVLRTGDKIQGRLVELGLEHIGLRCPDGAVTIIFEMIGLWKKLESDLHFDGSASTDNLTPNSIDNTTANNAKTPIPTQAAPAQFAVEVTAKIVEIEAQFVAAAKNVINLTPPIFWMGGYPGSPTEVLIKKELDRLRQFWDRNDADRLTHSAHQFAALTVDYPEVSIFAYNLGCIYGELNKPEKALQAFTWALMAGGDHQSSKNLAVIAHRLQEKTIACYALQHYLKREPIRTIDGGWAQCLILTCECQAYTQLCEIFDFQVNAGLDSTPTLIIESLIYLSKAMGRSDDAYALASYLIAGNPSPQSLTDIVTTHIGKIDNVDSSTYRENVDKFLEEAKLQLQENKSMVPARGAVSSNMLVSRNATPSQTPIKPRTLQKVIPPTIHGGLNLEHLYEEANRYADYGDYSKAITVVKKILLRNSAFPGAQESYAKWREYARRAVLPKGSNPFAIAKRAAEIDQDLEKAAELYREAIRQEDNLETSVKDYASVLRRLKRGNEAIEILLQKRPHMQDKRAIDNLLIDIYKEVGRYQDAINLLRKKLKTESDPNKKVTVLWTVASCYLSLEQYEAAENIFRQTEQYSLYERASKRNIALCLSRQGRYDEAEHILNEVLAKTPDAKSAELLDAIQSLRTTGESAQLDQFIDINIAGFSGEISAYTTFFLNRSDVKAVPVDRVQRGDFQQMDISRLENLASQATTRTPRERAEYYLSIAKILSETPSLFTSNLFYRSLYRSFASLGDAAVLDGKPIDAARAWYCEALILADGDLSRQVHEQDIANALVRFLFSILNRSQIPMDPGIKLSIGEAIDEVITRSRQPLAIFEIIGYIVIRSQWAANRVLDRLFTKPILLKMALEYLRSRDIVQSHEPKTKEEFFALWQRFGLKSAQISRTLSTELFSAQRIEFTTAWLDTSVEKLRKLEGHLVFELDKDRLHEVQRIFEMASDFCKEVKFEEQERLLDQIINARCQDLLRDIEQSPTKLSVEELYPIIRIAQEQASQRLQELYAISVPSLTLRLPKELPITPADATQQIEVQVVVENKMGCSPAESLELFVESDEKFYSAIQPIVKLDSSLRGGDNQILSVPLRVTKAAMDSQIFSLPVYARYRTRSSEVHEETIIESLSIRLFSVDEFQNIPNPYADYAKGGIVPDEMFYGRTTLITNIAQVIDHARLQSKSLIIYGQARAGKSSIVYHLKQELKKKDDLLIIDIGNIGSIADVDNQFTTPFAHLFLWSICSELKDVIEMEVESGRSLLGVEFPSDHEFLRHPSPFLRFKTLFDSLLRQMAQHSDWKSMRIVLLIDEFSYIYSWIVNGYVKADFMKTWKALLQENYFNAVLVGLDVMTKFIELYSNQFGTTEDIRVDYLEREAAVELIDEPIRIGGKHGESRYREKAIDRIYELTAGSPFYIQIICDRLVKYMNRKRTPLVSQADIEQIVNELTQDVGKLGENDFDNLLNSGDESSNAISKADARKVLLMIALNSRTYATPCSRSSITCETETPVDQVLDDLVRRKVIECEREQYYKISVGLFKEWLIRSQ